MGEQLPESLHVCRCLYSPLTNYRELGRQKLLGWREFFIKSSRVGIPWWLWLGLDAFTAKGQGSTSVVRELRSCKACGMTKKKKILEGINCLLYSRIHYWWEVSHQTNPCFSLEIFSIFSQNDIFWNVSMVQRWGFYFPLLLSWEFGGAFFLVRCSSLKFVLGSCLMLFNNFPPLFLSVTLTNLMLVFPDWFCISPILSRLFKNSDFFFLSDFLFSDDQLCF